eukprot:4338-Heterococcus_DN1.PRE.2
MRVWCVIKRSSEQVCAVVEAAVLVKVDADSHLTPHSGPQQHVEPGMYSKPAVQTSVAVRFPRAAGAERQQKCGD